MLDPLSEKLNEFQKLINYKFKNEELLRQALTTPKLGNELGIPHYEVLETLGDAVIKLIFSLKIYKNGADDPGELTKMKQCLESNRTFSMIAHKMNLEKYILASKKQKIIGTKTLADSLEAICGAVYLDSNSDLRTVEEKIINKFFQDWDSIILESSIFNKNKLLEYLQSIYKITPVVKCEFKNFGTDHEPKWIAMNPRVYNQKMQLLIKLPKELKSKSYKSQNQAEQELYLKILKYLKKQKYYSS
jgi:ribonuclease-3